ncbi:E3 ubiquitin-protein ligase SPL2-like [Pyrus communis]|uniref:E3 ubiquitin-protein ligase SPL2-like n=1 Tax=Pyrus communis TaxID=23211 RepID=UPI0035C0E238
MSLHERAVINLVSQLALSCDGAVLGVVLACAAVRTVIKFAYTSSALRKLRNAPYVKVSDLRAILAPDESQPSDAKLVVLRGTVEAKSAVDGKSNSLKSGVFVSRGTKNSAVVVQRTQTCVYKDRKNFIGFPFDLRSLILKPWREQESKDLRTVPFVLVEGGRRRVSEFVVVNVDESRHPLPLTTVYRNFHPVNASPYKYKLVDALFRHEYPIGFLDEEKILPLGKEITAVGLCSLKNGVPDIKSCKDLPYFLSEMSKDEMVVELTSHTRVLFWSGIVLVSMSIGILGYAVSRNWDKLKAWKQGRQSQQSIPAADGNPETQIEEEEEVGEVPDGQLCVICLMRRRRSAFTPCGHRVCCHPCSISIQRNVTPCCPVCRQDIRASVRIYDS